MKSSYSTKNERNCPAAFHDKNHVLQSRYHVKFIAQSPYLRVAFPICLGNTLQVPP